MSLTLIRAWFLKGTTPTIKSPTERFKVSIFGAMNRNGQLIIHTSEIFNAMTFKEFLEKLISNARTNKKILLVLDNARYHHAKILKEFLEMHKDKLELFFLPAYSPDLNAIEMLWRKTRRNVTHNRYFKNINELKEKLTTYWKQFDEPNEELQNLCAYY